MLTPESVSDDGHRRAARDLPFLGNERPSERGPDAQDVEVVARDEEGVEAPRALTFLKRDVALLERDDAGEAARLAREVGVVRPGRVDARARRGPGLDRHDVVRAGHTRQGIEQECPNPTEERGVGPDPQGERRDGDGREAAAPRRASRTA